MNIRQSRRPTSLITGAVVAAVMLLGCSREAVESGNEANNLTTEDITNVSVLTLQPTKWNIEIETYGQVRAVEEVQIGVDFSGDVVQVLFEEGDQVVQGQRLAIFDDKESKLRRTQAQKAAEQANTQLTDAVRQLRLKESLFDERVVSQDELDAAVNEVQLAQSRYDETSATLALAEEELDKLIITSPVTGIVESRDIEPGETLLSGGAVATIQNMNAMRVHAFVSGEDISYLSPGMSARIYLAGIEQRQYDVVLESTGIKADPNTGSFPIRFILNEPDRFVRPGMTVRVYLSGVELPNQLVVPESAVVDRGRRRVVYILREGVATELAPQLRVGGTNQFLVVGGLHSGDLLIISNLDEMTDGKPVTAKDQDES
ncbi:MAG: efflux RND transporter periplasmic adaptor subunit [Gammaproteobacteria bacterium]|nr:efflux RND transporter periplasmic adaptor subunit [Gammaproteobacteria bacterium]